ASQRSSADRVMIERMGKIKDPPNWTVVTSDNEVKAVALSRKMKVTTSFEFALLMESPPKPDIDAGEAAHVNITPEEVDEWLKVFGEVEPPPKRKPRKK
ncbi:MAG: hypothetical protein K8L99_19185, partial [Anaerolineae bacterium]|nr:hypothetical protein [Anaerolineae bacterium]